MALPDWLTLALFVVLVLVSGMHGLSASGHFPARGRSSELSGFGGSSLLFGSIALVAAALLARAVGRTQYSAGYLPYSIVDGWQQLVKDLAYWRVDVAATEAAAWSAPRR